LLKSFVFIAVKTDNINNYHKIIDGIEKS